MLEFQEGFFEQEVRDGFYLDVTMKTLWASELELLQKVAEVCAKYNLQWYAAYGTLLGAIRHEGFVPWDDDMDIWMMRKDYNKLMEVLPKELPEGYRVRGPLTDEGYEQFHTCVNNGSGISVAKEWLAANHNCPFTVGLDIFPLDYLPRNKKDRETQKNIFTLIGRIAQLAKGLYRGTFKEEASTVTPEEVIVELKDGLKYLKKNFKFSLDPKLIEEERWEKVTSEIWKWGNYVAMMYDEKESDYIVEYLDWVKMPTKKFPKAWFAETYAADFESVMLPIPCNYDEILLAVYSNYQIIARKTAAHEYPFYARQLRQLRQYVKNAEKGILGESIESVIEEREQLPEWMAKRVEEARKQGKKIILTANNTDVYVSDPQNALSNLEKRLEFFEKHTDQLLLWWRPHKMMSKVLGRISGDCVKQYEEILKKYKDAAWGICDEGDYVDWAVENCDIYYGEMNAILQQFQNEGKAILLSGEETEEVTAKNERMLLDSRTIVNYTDYVIVGNKMYFANTNFNALVIADAESRQILDMIPFEGEDIATKDMHLHCMEKNGKICFLPVGNGPVRIYDIESGKQTVVKLDMPEVASKATWDSFEFAGEIYLLPANIQQGIWLWDVAKDTFILQDWWTPGEADPDVKHSVIDDHRVVSLLYKSEIILITDFEQKTIVRHKLPNDDVCTIAGDGTTFWYTTWASNKVFRWNSNTGRAKEIEIPKENYLGKPFTPYYFGTCLLGENLYVTSRTGEDLFCLNINTQEVKHLGEMDYLDWDYMPWEKEPFFKVVDKKLVCMTRNTHKYRTIDLETDEVAVHIDYLKLGAWEEYRKYVSLYRGVLFYEEAGVYDENMLLLVR